MVDVMWKAAQNECHGYSPSEEDEVLRISAGGNRKKVVLFIE
jgi:hypothetical protein